MLVVPGVMGVGVWSPPLDTLGNTVRGVAFAEKLVNRWQGGYYSGKQTFAFTIMEILRRPLLGPPEPPLSHIMYIRTFSDTMLNGH